MGMVTSLTDATVLVLGASGQVGRFVIPILVARGARVVAISRQQPPEGYPDFESVSWRTPTAAAAEAVTATALVSAGPLALALDWLADAPGIGRVAATSSTSVITKRDAGEPAERRLMVTLLELETRLVDACSARDASLCLLRPTLVYGAGLDQNLSRLAGFIRRFGFLPLAGGAPGRRQPLHAEDLAAALVSGLDRGAGLVGPLAGGETLDYREMAGRIFDALARPRRLLPVPAGVLAVAARLAGRGANAGMVRRQAVDLVFDDAQTRARLAIHPRGFAPGPEDFRPPDAARLRALAATGSHGAGAQEC